MINWDRIEELKEEIGEEDFDEVAEMFLQEVDEVILRLKTNPQPAEYEQDMHFLKSSALNVGFKALSQLCSAGEFQAASGNGEAVQLQPIFDTYEASVTAFQSKR